MADSVTTQIIQNGARNIIVKFTNVSDGSGETLVKKVDAQSATYGVTVQGQVFVPGVHLTVKKLIYDIRGFQALEVLWDATTPTDMVLLSGAGTTMNFEEFGGLTCPAVAGATGSILFTTLGAALNASYTVTMFLAKNVPQT